jgi:hypothetical protein
MNVIRCLRTSGKERGFGAPNPESQAPSTKQIENTKPEMIQTAESPSLGFP